MAYSLFARVSLREDFPEYGLHERDLATIVEKHQGEPGQETGYSLEVFNAIGETIAVLVVEESKIEPVKKNEILHVRRLDKVAGLWMWLIALSPEKVGAHFKGDARAEIAGMKRLDFLLAISRLGVSPFQYTVEDVLKEIENVK